MNVISCNFLIFGAIFMQFLPKCNTKSDIGKLVIKFGYFCLCLGKNRPITGPKFALGKSLILLYPELQMIEVFKKHFLRDTDTHSDFLSVFLGDKTLSKRSLLLTLLHSE